jgi:hypothetical protein
VKLPLHCGTFNPHLYFSSTVNLDRPFTNRPL